MEIEVKAKVDDLEKIRKRLESEGAKFGNTVEQVDTYFKPKDFSSKTEGPGDWILRIRREGNNKTLTLKALTEVLGAWIEHETVIESEEQAIRIAQAMGLVNVFTFHKKRTRGEYEKFELCIDNVRELGTYLEVALEPDESCEKEALRGTIIEFLKSLGIEEKDIERRGYGEIMGEKMGHKFGRMK